MTALREEDAYPALPEDGYGWEKLFSERMCRNFQDDFGIETPSRGTTTSTGRTARTPAGARRRRRRFAARSPRRSSRASTRSRSGATGADAQLHVVDDCLLGDRIMESDILDPINLGSSELVTINQLVATVEEIAGVKLSADTSSTPPRAFAGATRTTRSSSNVSAGSRAHRSRSAWRRRTRGSTTSSRRKSDRLVLPSHLLDSRRAARSAPAERRDFERDCARGRKGFRGRSEAELCRGLAERAVRRGSLRAYEEFPTERGVAFPQTARSSRGDPRRVVPSGERAASGRDPGRTEPARLASGADHPGAVGNGSEPLRRGRRDDSLDIHRQECGGKEGTGGFRPRDERRHSLHAGPLPSDRQAPPRQGKLLQGESL